MDFLNPKNTPPGDPDKSEVQYGSQLSKNYEPTVFNKTLINATPKISNEVDINKATLEDMAVNAIKTELMDSFACGDSSVKMNSKFSCIYCTKQFAKKQQLQNHIKTHTKEKNFQCQNCSKRFVHKQQLMNHEKTHSGKKDFECVYCGKCFILKQQMQIHLKTHTGEKNFCCYMCEKLFITKQQLQNHINSHLGIKPFYCEICSKNFAHKQQLVRHEKRHNKEVLFCADCNIKFECKESLSEHIDGQHRYSKELDVCNPNNRYLSCLL